MIRAVSEETEESAAACILFWLLCVLPRIPYYRRISVLVPFIISFTHNFVKCWLISGRPPQSLRHSLGLITLTLIWLQSSLIIKAALLGAV